MRRGPRALNLPLDCEACGWQGPHPVHMVLFLHRLEPLPPDAPEAEQAAARRFGPVVIPHPVRCPHCDALNRYHVPEAERTARAWFRLCRASASEPWRVRRVRSGSRVGDDLHPCVAALRFQRLLARSLDDAALRLHCANTLRSGGDWDAAKPLYRAILGDRTAPLAVRLETAYNLALMAGCEQDRAAMGAYIRRGLELARSPQARRAPPHRTVAGPVGVRLIAAHLHDLLCELIDAAGPEPATLLPCFFSLGTPTPLRRLRLNPRTPCPCGSGYTFSHCCGR